MVDAIPFSTRNTAVQAQIQQEGEHLWKCIRYFDPTASAQEADNEWRVFELRGDPHEMHDLSADPHHAARVTQLKAELLSWGARPAAPSGVDSLKSRPWPCEASAWSLGLLWD